MFKNLAGMANLLKNANQIGENFAAVKDQLRQLRVHGNAGGGMVKAEMNGLGEVFKITIDPDLVARNETEMIETLLQAAINEASGRAREKHAEVVKDVIGSMELPLPGLSKALEGLGEL